MEKVYVLYYDYDEIEVDKEGHITNEKDCVFIAEYEWDEETETLGKFLRRVDYEWKDKVFEVPMDITVEEMEMMDSIGDCSDTPSEAYIEFYEWLKGCLVWGETSPQTYLQPAEYECVGLEGRVDDEVWRYNAWRYRVDPDKYDDPD